MNTLFYGWKNAWRLFFIYMANTGLVFYAYTVVFPMMIQATGWNRGDASIASSLNMVMMGMLVPPAAFILRRIGSRKMIIIGLIILLIDLLLLATITTRMWHWIVIWGLGIPLAAVLCGFYPVQITVMKWFERKRSTALGFVMTGAALGGFVAQPVYTWFMQLTGAWQTGWLLSAGVTFLALLLSFQVKGQPEDVGQFPDGIDPANTRDGEKSEEAIQQTDKSRSAWAVRDVFKTSTIWCIAVVMLAQSMPTIMLTNHGILHLTDLGHTQMHAATVLMFVIMGSGMARFPAGWLGDRIEPRRIVTASIIIMLVSFAGIWQGFSYALLLIYGSLFGIAYGSLLVMISTMIANYYGPDAYVSTSAVIAPVLTIINSSVPTIAGYAADRLGTYDLPFTILTGIILTALIVSLFLAPPKKPAEVLQFS